MRGEAGHAKSKRNGKGFNAEGAEKKRGGRGVKQMQKRERNVRDV